jgi:hypothetical protein
VVKPGVCGICGTAVVQPEREEVGWHQGHLRETRLKANQTKFTELVLVRVRCMTHKESGDPRFYSSDGRVVEQREWCSAFDWMAPKPKGRPT